MNVDEALLVADGISLTALGSKGPDCALLVLAKEVRRQHAEIEAVRSFCVCSCCGGVDQCAADCTLADDDQNEAARLEAMRGAMR